MCLRMHACRVHLGACPGGTVLSYQSVPLNFPLEKHMSHAIQVSESLQETPSVFDIQFSRCRGLLYFIACRVLGGHEGAEDAVQNCFLTASRNPPRFEQENAFRGWLLRILIDEALILLYQRKGLELQSPPSTELGWMQPGMRQS